MRNLLLCTIFLSTLFARIESLSRKCNVPLREEDGKVRPSKSMGGLSCPRFMKGEKSNLWIRIHRSKNNRKIMGKRRLMVRVCNVFYSCVMLLLAGDIEVNPGPNMNTFSVIDCSRLEGAGSLLVAMGHTHQGDECYNENSRGRQCAFMALTSLVYNFQKMPAENWSSSIIDAILRFGDCEFSYAIQHGHIPDLPNFSVENLPRILYLHDGEFFFAWNDISTITNYASSTTSGTPHQASSTKESPIEANFTKELPIEANFTKESPIEANFTKELPIEATCTKEAPIEANCTNKSPIEANFTKQSPIEVYYSDFLNEERYESPYVTNRNKKSVHSIDFGSVSQGSFFHQFISNLESPFINLEFAFQHLFRIYNSALFILEGYMISIMKNSNAFYVFDSHARNPSGMPDLNGKAVLLKLENLDLLINYLTLLAIRLNIQFFEVVGVSFNSLDVHFQMFPNIQSREETLPNSKIKNQQENIYSLPTDCDKRNSIDDLKRKKRLQSKCKYAQVKRCNESAEERQKRLKKDRASKARNFYSKQDFVEKCRTDFLCEFQPINGRIFSQKWARSNITKFHQSIKFVMTQCSLCFETWPVKYNTKFNTVCSRCIRDKKIPKKFSKENGMIPSKVPTQLQHLTQVEEMLIARVLPIMSVYVRPGGQRAYHGHCINLPQKVEKIASKLPHYPKDINVIVVCLKGRNNFSRDLNVRRQVVHDALLWLVHHNPLYKDIVIQKDALDNLPENGVPCDLMTAETEVETVHSNSTDGHNCEEDEEVCSDKVYNENTDMISFLPLSEQQEKEIDGIRSQISQTEPLNWPIEQGADPINEYNTPFLATMAFPTLFPDGLGDPTNEATLRNVSFHEKVKHLMKFGEIIDGRPVYRFASHPRFPYWCLNMIQRKKVLQQTSIFLKQNPTEAHLTVDELREIAETNSGVQIMAKMSRYVGNILGSNAYWYKVREELKAIIANKGPPTIFFTFSAADMHWPELHDIFGHGCQSEHSHDERRKNVINNPHLVDWFFTKRIESFIKHWLYDTLDAEWHWYRFEYQHRGSIHCHGTAKLKNDPDLCKLTDIALKGFLAHKMLQQSNESLPSDINQLIYAGQHAEQNICQYVDWILTTVNQLPPETETWVRPKVHPCQKRPEDIAEADLETDYIDLVNTVQRHSKCSTSYCLRQKEGEVDLKCRFNFPFENRLQTELQFEEINSRNCQKNYRAKLMTKRNDPRLNSNQQCQLQGWRANCDIQVVIDHYACVEYLTKYAAKGEPKSPAVNQLFKSVIQKSTGSCADSQKILKQVAMKSLGERDFSAQETMHLLLSLKLHSSSFNVVPINLTGSRKVRDIDSSHENVDISTERSLLDAYSHREQYDDSSEFLNMNLAQFAAKYRIFKNQLVTLPKNAIPRIFPTYSPNPAGTNFPLYCKFQLLRYNPWTGSQNSAWGCDNPSDETFIDAWRDFLQTPYAERNVPDWLHQLENVISNQEEQFHYSPDDTQNTQEEWMVLAGLNSANDAQSFDSYNCNWHEDRNHYAQRQIDEMPQWIKCRRDEESLHPTQQQYDIDISNLNVKQRLAYDLVISHFNSNSDKDPLCLIVIGVAGTGKSYLINSLRSTLQSKCAVTATTGKAAFNIQGVTIHSLLKLPVGISNKKDLSGEGLCRLQETLNGIEYIVIDEYSMLGQNTFGWIDRRCRQATGSLHRLFGGKSLILFGDPGQLPPVGDKPLYHSHPTNEIGEQGYFAYIMFDKVIELTVNQRVCGESIQQCIFRDLLFRLRNGETTQNDWKLLMTRSPSNASNVSQFTGATRLFYSNQQVASFNYEKLKKLQHPIACIEARHSSKAAKNASSDDMSGLEPTVYLSKNARVMLTMNLWPSVGLCNGATGTVIDIIYQRDHRPPCLPIAVVVKFDGYRGVSFSDQEPSLVPICPVTVRATSNPVSERQQLPLRLSWAFTIHKSQGMTLSRAWVDIGKSETTIGMSYVALSRVKTLSSLVIEPVTFERLNKIKLAAAFQYRTKEQERLKTIADQTNCIN